MPCEQQSDILSNKIRHLANRRYGHNNRHQEHGHSHRRAFEKSRPYKRDDKDRNRSFKRNDRNHKAPPKREDKAFEEQPCHIHGPKSQHSYDKCYKNPRNQDNYFPDKKRNHKAHHNNKQEAINNEGSCASMDWPPASDSAVSHSEDEEQDKEEQYHVHSDKNVKGGAGMAHVPRKRKSAKATVSTTLKRKSRTFLDNDLNLRFDFGNNPNDTVLMGLDSLIAGDNDDDVTNPFDFK